ncbi:MAG: heparinase II/III family protein [Armatimonadetes bacterium]|nr:heparinase II/III family protein [Armatimonadota bacterium]
MRDVFAVLSLALIGEVSALGAAAAQPPDFSYVLQHIQPTHPRLFLNQEMLQKIKKEGLTQTQEQWLATLKERVDGYPAPPSMDDKLAAFMLGEEGGRRYGPTDPPRVFDGDWGYWSAHAALAYLLTGERRYYDKSVSLLKHAAGIYAVIHDNDRIPYGKAYGRLSAVSTYDWLYNDIPQPERQALGKALFTPLHSFYEFWRRLRKGAGDVYADNLLGWPLGLVFLRSGIEGVSDQLCVDLLRKEYEEQKAMFEELTEGQDGVWLYGALGYSPQNTQTEINLFDIWRSAIGGNFAGYFPKRANLAEYYLWNTIAPTRRPPQHYGWSDEHHINNLMDQRYWDYLNRVPDLYAGVGGEVDVNALTAIAQFQAPVDPMRFLPKSASECWQTPAAPLLMSVKTCSPEEIQKVLARLPRARNFPDPIGHFFMNSGWGENDTYAMFVAGRQTTRRKHFDENHFTIYKKGFLALDSGARGYSVRREAGQENDPRNVGIDHEINYYYDTVAHNSILIYMEGEKLPGFWGQASVCNTGGMNKNYGAQVKGFETNDRYTYIASDATSCYNEAKAQEVVRQFLFVYPDYFVVFDRVASRMPEQKKTWLMHTQFEPQVQGDTFWAEHREGKMLVRTLLPQAARFGKTGGPGKEFWAGDRNWPVRVDYQRFMQQDNLFGQWRTEVTSAQDNQREIFLHLIQVGDRQELKEMTPSRRIEEGQQVGVEFQAGNTTVRALFSRDGEVGGHIRITEGSRVLVDQPLTREVQPQSGLALAP